MALKGLEDLKAYSKELLDSATTAEATTEAEKFAQMVELVEQDHEAQNKAWADKYRNAIRHTAIKDEPEQTIQVAPSSFGEFATEKLAQIRNAKK